MMIFRNELESPMKDNNKGSVRIIEDYSDDDEVINNKMEKIKVMDSPINQEIQMSKLFKVKTAHRFTHKLQVCRL